MTNRIEANNSATEIEIRKCRSMLRITSSAVMILGVWSFVRSFIMTALGAGSGYDTEGGLAAAIAGSAIAIAMDLAFRMRIYRGARIEASEEARKKNLYLIYALILIIISIAVIGINIYALFAGDEQSIFTTMVQITVELTSMLVSFQLIHSAMRLRKLRKHEAAAAGTEHV